MRCPIHGSIGCPIHGSIVCRCDVLASEHPASVIDRVLEAAEAWTHDPHGRFEIALENALYAYHAANSPRAVDLEKEARAFPPGFKEWLDEPCGACVHSREAHQGGPCVGRLLAQEYCCGAFVSVPEQRIADYIVDNSILLDKLQAMECVLDSTVDIRDKLSARLALVEEANVPWLAEERNATRAELTTLRNLLKRVNGMLANKPVEQAFAEEIATALKEKP